MAFRITRNQRRSAEVLTQGGELPETEISALRKDDQQDCNNYRRLSLLCVVHKVLNRHTPNTDDDTNNHGKDSIRIQNQREEEMVWLQSYLT